MTTHLIHFRISHYNEKVRWALDFKQWPHTREARIPGFHLGRVKRLTGKYQLPVVLFDGEPLAGSGAIIEELERRQPEPTLLPADAAQRERAMTIQAFFDDEVAPALRRLFWSTYLPRAADCTRMATMGASGAKRIAFRTALPFARGAFKKNMGIYPEQLAQARERLGSYFDRIEAELQPSGFLVGDRFGIADLAVASVMSAIIRPPQFPYPLPEPQPPELVEMRESVAKRAGYQWVMEMYAKHRPASAEIE